MTVVESVREAKGCLNAAELAQHEGDRKRAQTAYLGAIAHALVALAEVALTELHTGGLVIRTRSGRR